MRLFFITRRRSTSLCEVSSVTQQLATLTHPAITAELGPRSRPRRAFRIRSADGQTEVGTRRRQEVATHSWALEHPPESRCTSAHSANRRVREVAIHWQMEAHARAEELGTTARRFVIKAGARRCDAVIHRIVAPGSELHRGRNARVQVDVGHPRGSGHPSA